MYLVRQFISGHNDRTPAETVIVLDDIVTHASIYLNVVRVHSSRILTLRHYAHFYYTMNSR